MTNDTTGAPGAAPGPTPENRPEPGMRGWVKLVFILSLILNFLVLGVITGGVVGHFRHAPPPPVLARGGGPDAFAFGPLAGAFTRDDRIAMRRAAEGAGTDLAAMQAQVQSDFERLDSALRAKPYDEAALQVVLTEMRARMLARTDLGEQVMLRRIRAMSDAERAAFADRMQKGLDRMRDHFEAHRDDRRDDRRGPAGAPPEPPPPELAPPEPQPTDPGRQAAPAE